MRGYAAFLVLSLAGCGEPGPVGEDRGVTANQIARLSTPEVEPTGDPLASAKLQPLRRSDSIGAAASGGCRFSANQRILLVSTAAASVARVGGQLRHFVSAAPIGGTGGFFEDRNVSISVGRAEPSAAAGEAGRWPARITVTNRRTGAQTRLNGHWRCEPLVREPQ